MPETRAAVRRGSADRARRKARPSAESRDRPPAPAPLPPAAAARPKVDADSAKPIRTGHHQLQQLLHACANPLLGPALDLRNQTDIPLHREMRKQASLLDDVPNARAATESRRPRSLGTPFTRISPEVGETRRFTSLRVVVLPEPLRPSSTRISPCATRRLRPLST